MSEPRFIVREISGYNIKPQFVSVSTGGKPVTDVMILDRGYCHRVVRSYPANPGNGQPTLLMRRIVAEREAARLNAEDVA